MKNWTPLGYVPSQAKSAAISNGYDYTYGDANPVSGKNYYRLRIESLSGVSTYSDIVNVISNGKEKVQIYPNPAVNNFHIKGAQVSSTYKVVDMSGKTVLTGVIAGNDTVIQVTGLAKGVYFVEIQAPNNGATNRFKVLKH